MINEYIKQSLRQLMSLMLFCSAVFLTACGGAGEAEDGASTVTTRTIEPTQIESVERDTESVQQDEVTIALARDDIELDGAGTDSNIDSTSDEQQEVDAIVVDSSLPDSSQEESDTTLTSGNVGDLGVITNNVDNQTTTTDTTDTNTVAVTYTATIQWDAPSQRENGSALNLYEISGYEVQYRKVGAAAFTVVRVDEDGSGAQSLDIEVSSDSDYELLIASYDIDGLYSDYYETRIEDVANSVNGG